MVGAPFSILGEKESQQEEIVQVGGEALVLDAADFVQITDEDRSFRDAVLGYIGVRLYQATRSAACNRLHSAEERLARWFLHVDDWTWEDRVPLTQDLLSVMLGVRRPTVSTTVENLDKSGVIAHGRGITTILDRSALEEIACEDYVAIRDAFDRVFGPAEELSA